MATDANTTLADLRQCAQAFTTARAWDGFHTPRSLAVSIAVEAAELLEHYQWREEPLAATPEETARAQAEIADELADIVIYCLHFANATQTDITQAVLAKLARNETRFPAGELRGKLADER